MNHVNFVISHQAPQPQEPSEIPWSIRVEAMCLPPVLVQGCDKVGLPTDQICHLEIETDLAGDLNLVDQ